MSLIRQILERRLAYLGGRTNISFIQTRENIDKMVNTEADLRELCSRIVPGQWIQ